MITDQTPEMTEQAEIHISLFRYAMLSAASQTEREDNAYAGNSNNAARVFGKIEIEQKGAKM